jgi:hypothetical protein
LGDQETNPGIIRNYGSDRNYCSDRISIFFHPDYTVGAGISPVQFGLCSAKVAGYTAGWEWFRMSTLLKNLNMRPCTRP